MISLPAFEALRITKRFGGVDALRGASFVGRPGRIHGLVGENGAGKSTLMRVVAGVVQPDEGELRINGREAHVADPADAHRLGIAMVHQDTRLALDLDAAHNVWLGHEPASRLGIIASDELYVRTRDLLAPFELDVDLRTPTRLLTSAERQAVEIARSLSLDARVLILDEPTSALDARESDRLFRVLRQLRDHGVCVVFVSHRLPEVLSLVDDVTVMKDGEVVRTLLVADASEDELVRLMVGRDLGVVLAECAGHPGEPVLEVASLGRGRSFTDVSFTVHRGEVVGIGGIAGNGQRDIARAVAGLEPAEYGSIRIAGRDVAVRSPRDAIAKGVVYTSHDRRDESLMMPLSVRENVALPTLSVRARAGFVRSRAERATAQDVAAAFDIRTPSIETPVEALSGGNQQKVAIGRWQLASPQVLVLDDPTQGVDVASKLEIHGKIRALVGQGAGALLLSSDLVELITLSDRILVLSGGRVVGEVSGDEATEEHIVGAAVTAMRADEQPSRRAPGGSTRPRSRARLAYWQSPLLLFVLLVLGTVITAALSPYFLTPENLGNLAIQTTPLALVAAGQALVVLLGGVDLTVGATVGLVVALASHLITQAAPVPPLIGASICVLAGMSVGLANGLVIRYLRLPDLIVTLAGLFVVSGLALIIRPSPGGLIVGDFVSAVTAAIGPVPLAALATLSALLLIEVWLQATRGGSSMYATGSSREAAFVAGLRVDRIRVLAYVASGALAAMAGLVLTARLGAGDATAGNAFTLASVTAVVVGGFRVAGGRGTVTGALMGAVLVIGMQNALNMLHVSAYWQYVWVGALTLVGVMSYSVDWSGLKARLAR